MTWLLRNWHLKLAAVGLAMVLYTGFVYSGSFTDQLFPGLPVQAINQPDGAFPLTQSLGTVDVQYRLSATAEQRVTDESFAVSVNLADYDMSRAPQLQSLPISVDSLQEGVEILSFAPRSVPVGLDRLAQRQVRVEVQTGEVPEGLETGSPRVSASSVVASGPQSQLGRVDRAIARVQVFESGIDVRQAQVDLVPVDVDGREVESVELDPATVSVEIDVRTVETSKTVPIRPDLAGVPAEGSEVGSVNVEPAVVTLFGEPAALEGVVDVATEPISLSGATETITRELELVLPDGTRLAEGSETPVVTVTIRPSIETRTFVVGVTCHDAPQDTTCLPQIGQVSVTLRGPAATLAGIDAADLAVLLDASGQEPGDVDLDATVSLPSGVRLVAISPASVPVVIEAAPAPSPGS